MEGLNDIIGAEPVKRDDGFVIQEEKHALWATGKMRQAEQARQELKARYEAYRNQLDAWYEKEAKNLESTVSTMADLLRPYIAEQIAHGKKKSLTLPDGTKAGYRTGQETLTDQDPGRTLSWCLEYAPECVKTEEKVLKSKLKERLKEGKPIPPSVDIEPGRERFYVDTTEASDD